MLVALTITPALSLLPGTRGAGAARPLGPWLRRGYARVLRPSPPRAALAWVLVSFLGAAVLAAQLGEGFLPQFQETDFLMRSGGRAGTSLDAMRRGPGAGEPRVQSWRAQFRGRASAAPVADEVVGPNVSSSR